MAIGFVLEITKLKTMKKDIKKAKIKEDLLNLILGSRMKFEKKMLTMKLLDQLFRKELGVFYLSDKELEDKDILNRSM